MPIDDEPDKPKLKDRTRDINNFFEPAHEKDGKKYRTCLHCRCVPPALLTANHYIDPLCPAKKG